MVDHGVIQQLLGYQRSDDQLLSVYVTPPAEPLERRALLSRLDTALDAAVDLAGTHVDDGYSRRHQASAKRLRAASAAVRELAGTRTRDWFGRSTLVVATPDDGVVDEVRIPGGAHHGGSQREVHAATERYEATFGHRVRMLPLLAATQRFPAFVLVVVDRRHAQVFRVHADQIELIDQLGGEVVRDKSFAGWHGLEEYRARHRADEMARKHYHATAEALAHASAKLADGALAPPVVVAGHETGIAEFTALLSEQARHQLAGSFAVDPHAMTPAGIRDQATSVLRTWLADRERQLAVTIDEQTAGAADHVVHGLSSCADAAWRGLVDTLIVREPDPGEQRVPGRACDACGWLRARPNTSACPRCQEPTRWLADPVDEVAVRVLDLRGRVELVTGPAGAGSQGHDLADDVWARLRSPLPTTS